MKIRLAHGLPYITVKLSYQGQTLVFQNVLVDTGSASTIFSADKVLEVGSTPHLPNYQQAFWPKPSGLWRRLEYEQLWQQS